MFTQGAYLAKEGDSVVVRIEKDVALRVPIHTLGGILCFGRVGVSPFLMGLCGERGVAVSFCTLHGRFLARVSGFTPGSVLLRREQYRWADDPSRASPIARSIILGKISNSRTVLLRAAREGCTPETADALAEAALHLSRSIDAAKSESDVDSLRGIEGDAASTYFGVFRHLIRSSDPAWSFGGRTRRPPLDRTNSLLSFLYAMLSHDARAACEACGLDPAVGFLHVDRPGRPSLALDLVEEFRAFISDRLAVSLVNRGQVKPEGFIVTESGAVEMTEATRRAVVAAYQRRKQDVILSPYLGEKTTIGLLIHLQARLLSRHLRGDLDAYPPFLWR